MYPILAEFDLNPETRIGVVSMIVHPPAVSVDFISTEARDEPVLLTTTLSIDEGPSLTPIGGGRSGGDRWMRHRVHFAGRIPETPKLITFTVTNRAAPEETVVRSGPPTSTTRLDTTYQEEADVQAARAHDRDRTLPLEVRSVDAPIDSMENHRVVCVERWSRSSLLVVHALGDYQIPMLPLRAVGHDPLGRTYGVLSDGGGNHEAGAFMYLRVAPALPTDIDQLVLIPSDLVAGGRPITLPVG